MDKAFGIPVCRVPVGRRGQTALDDRFMRMQCASATIAMESARQNWQMATIQSLYCTINHRQIANRANAQCRPASCHPRPHHRPLLTSLIADRSTGIVLPALIPEMTKESGRRLPPDDEDELKQFWTETFERFDENHDGTLSKDEVQKVLDDANLPTTRSQLDALFKCMDWDGDGVVDLEEFLAFASRRRTALRQAFESILAEGTADNDSATETASATLTAGHLRRASAKADLPLSDRDVRSIMDRVRENSGGSNQVTFDDFCKHSMLIPHVNAHAYFDTWFSDFVVDDSVGGYTVARETRVENDESFVAAALQKLSCGGTAGVLSRTMTAPLDRIRLLLMTSTTPISISQAYNNAISTAELGFRGLWLGNGVNCTKIAPEMGIKLFAFDMLKNKVASDPDNVTAAERFVAGGTAGALAEVSVYPMEVMRTRMGTGIYSSLRQCFSTILSEGGATALYAGVGPSVAGIIPYAAIDLTVNSILRDYAAEYIQQQQREASVPLLLSCGMLSSATATICTFPLNVIRTQAQATAKPLSILLPALQKEGIRGFYRGMVPCLLKVMPATSISYASYEWLHSKMDKMMKQI